MITPPHSSPAADTAADTAAEKAAQTVADAAADAPVGPGGVQLVAGALATAAVSVAVLVATHPWGERLDSAADDVLSYDVLLRSDRDVAWAGLLIDGFSFAVVALCAALGTCLLTRKRGRIAALVGSVMTMTGGVLFAMGSSGFAALTWFATSDGLSEEAGRELIAVGNGNLAHLLGLEMAGFLLITVGGLTLALALARAKAVPLAAIVAFVALTLALFAPLPTRGVDTVQVLQMGLIASLAVPLCRRGLHRRLGPS